MQKQFPMHRLARLMDWFSQTMALALPLAYLALCLTPGGVDPTLAGVVPGIATPELPLAQFVVGLLLGGIPVGLIALAFWHAHRFFGLYRDANLFPPAAGLVLRRMGKLFLAVAIISPLIRIAASVLFSWHLGEGKRQLIISLSSSDAFLILLSGLFFMVSYILAEATRIADENQQII